MARRYAGGDRGRMSRYGTRGKPKFKDRKPHAFLQMLSGLGQVQKNGFGPRAKWRRLAGALRGKQCGWAALDGENKEEDQRD